MESTWDTDFRDSTRFWVQFVLVPIIIIVGIIGNCVTVYILNKKQSHLSSNVYLTALAISDAIYLIGSFSLSLKHYSALSSVRLYWDYLPFGLWITDASSSTSVWLTVCYTIERCIAVSHPMSVKATITQKRVTGLVIGVFIACFILTASTPWEWKTVAVEDMTLAKVTFTLENTDLGQSPWYRFLFHWFSIILFVFIPMIILSFGNHRLISSVRESREIRQNLINCHTLYHHQEQMIRKENRLSVTLIAIISLFLACQMPTALVLLYTSIRTPEKASAEENVLLALGNICNLLVAVNAACNFVLYTATSEKYRNDFLNAFGLMPVVQQWRKRSSQPIPVAMERPSGNGLSQQDDDQEVDGSMMCATSELCLDTSLKDVIVLSHFTSYNESGRKHRFSVESWKSSTV